MIVEVNVALRDDFGASDEGFSSLQDFTVKSNIALTVISSQDPVKPSCNFLLRLALTKSESGLTELRKHCHFCDVK